MKPGIKIIYNTILICVIIPIALSRDYYEISRPIVRVQQGQLQGVKEKTVDGNNYFYAFRGIPYAKPPVGNLRFKEPEPVEAWPGVKVAEDFGNVCPQKYTYTQEIVGSEDCLYLNVYTTNLDPCELKTVMFWIHTGGFSFGSGNDDRSGPDYLVQKDIVLVTINYRLNIFGFLNLDDEEAAGNQGLKDQVMALKWVRQNIDKFGGDPNRVTIFGESAGAASVHYLTLSPLAQGLFDKAILQSGVATNPWARQSHSMKLPTEEVVKELGKSISDPKKLIEYLRSVDAHSVIQAIEASNSQQNNYVRRNEFVPSVDSKSKNPFLNISIIEAVKYGIKVPHIIGFTGNESLIIIAELKDEDYTDIEANQDTQLIQPNERQFLQERNVSVGDVKKFFMGDNEISRENARQFVELVSAESFTINIHDVVEIQSSLPDIPTYFYKFDHYSKETAVVQKLVDTDLEGTSLTEDLYYLFNAKLLDSRGITRPAYYPIERIIQRRFLELWTNFAKTGNPNCGASELIPIEWLPVDSSDNYNCLEISENLRLIKQPNILHQIEKFAQNNN
ncbi:juvenile hormone esterase-like [Microplitis mediator]|uniref:juvenile hormone esterase-like n=1 Tax=Microplitis mediator TaxID=375433 RepID=UPI0025556AF4|nr:juvenile hormone esterase-like [Microplitis mediator]